MKRMRRRRAGTVASGSRRGKKETRREPNRLEISRLLPARRSACKSRSFVLTLETRKKEKRREGREGRENKKNHHFHSSRRNIGRHRRRQNNTHYPSFLPSFEVNRLRGNFIRCQKAQRNHPRCTRLPLCLSRVRALCMNRPANSCEEAESERIVTIFTALPPPDTKPFHTKSRLSRDNDNRFHCVGVVFFIASVNSRLNRKTRGQ